MNVDRVVDVATTTVPAPGMWIVLATGIVALVVAASNTVLSGFEVLSTLCHEFGHAFASMITGGDARRIEIHSASEGTTETGHRDGISVTITFAVGYITPALLGAGASVMVAGDQAPAVLAIGVLVMTFALALSRNLRAVLSSLIVAATFAVVLLYTDPYIQSIAATLVVWLLLLGEFGALVGLFVSRVTGRALSPHDDAKNLAEHTHIPGIVWIIGWFAVCGWSVIFGATMLWP